MRNPLRSFNTAEPAILSFNAEANRSASPRTQGQFEVLVRHLLHRFLNHELLASDSETRRVLQIAYAVALPTLLVALFLFPPYHAAPPLPHPRPFWSQVGDHYFFVMYAFVLMGIATVYEWDLLFPDLLDVYVLSVLPIRGPRLFAARVLAVALFLGVTLCLTTVLGILFFPLLAELPNPFQHLFAHAVSVLLSGTFAAAAFLAFQGVLLNLLGERWFRSFGPLLQGLSLMLLLAVLLLTPTLNGDMQSVLTSVTPAVRWFPPFWFLGIYECLLHGSTTVPPVFRALALTGIRALVAATACLVLTYPLAYHRRVRQLIEGEAAARPKRPARSWHRLLNGLLLRNPAHRATFHFASQTVLRSQRHRVMLALYGGLTLALVLAEMLVLRVANRHISPSLLPTGLRAAVPISVYLTVIALRGAIWAPVDLRGAWIFRSILGRPRPQHLSGTRRWITFWAALVGVLMTLSLHWLAPPELRTVPVLLDQLILTCGLALVLSDLYLYPKESLPFTDLRITSITDMPFTILRNFIVFPTAVAILVGLQPAFEHSWLSLLKLALFFAAAHWAITKLHARSVEHLNADALVADEDVFPQGLGLRDG